MIERYDSPEISQIWSEKYKFQTFLKVELALVKALEKNNVIDKGTSELISEKAVINPERIKEIEKITKHDVIAFCTSITENLSQSAGKYFHYGCTSSDIIDTALTLQIRDSLDLVRPQLKNLKESLLSQAKKTQNLAAMGRSHGMNAEPMSFGQKFLGFYAEVSRRLNDLEHFYQNELTGQFSGAVGNYTVLTPEIEKDALEILELKTEPVSTQVIPRDRVAKLISLNAQIANALERIAIEIRHLHHSDLGEVFEGFSQGQKGSSTMPHKKNPISCENISGLARVIRSHVSMAFENTLLWHERDISHSSAERMMLPDNLGLLYYAIRRMDNTIKNLVINENHIESKVKSEFTYLSSYILHSLLKDNDMSREEIYAIVQKASFEAKDVTNFIQLIKSERLASPVLDQLQALDIEKIKEIYLKNFVEVLKRTEELYSKD